jgi:NAD(P)-dependent dehydrogenase (short-subunit alcohol dehydrogenase family)
VAQRCPERGAGPAPRYAAAVPSRTALITGANRGIGREIARQLAAMGIAVVVGARDLAAGQAAARELGPDVRAEQLDVSDPGSVGACEQRLADAGVEIDILVNNAGLYTTTPLLAVDEPALVEALQVNFIGAWRAVRAFVPGMRARGWGRVVNVSTGYAHFADRPPEAGAYGLAKASLNVLTRMIAAEAGTRVKVNSVSPGWVATRMGGSGAPRSVEEGADTAVWLATLPDDGPTDGFYYDRRRLPW